MGVAHVIIRMPLHSKNGIIQLKQGEPISKILHIILTIRPFDKGKSFFLKLPECLNFPFEKPFLMNAGYDLKKDSVHYKTSFNIIKKYISICVSSTSYLFLMKKSRTLILSGLGLNCEKETAYACQESGANKVDIVHILKVLTGEIPISDYQFLIFIGGFLDGDYLGAAKLCANRITYGYKGNQKLKEDLLSFIKAGKPVLGICNGFQLLVKLGLLPNEDQAFNKQTVSLAPNCNSKFENRWVHLKVNEKSPCLFTKGISSMYLPIRHAEGRFITDGTQTEIMLQKNQQVVMQYATQDLSPTSDYPENPNGAWQSTAGICNIRGNVFGLMPHPEAYNHYTNHPHWTRLKFESEDGEGLKIFKNAYQYLK